jgi:hypothetical protein
MFLPFFLDFFEKPKEKTPPPPFFSLYDNNTQNAFFCKRGRERERKMIDRDVGREGVEKRRRRQELEKISAKFIFRFFFFFFFDGAAERRHSFAKNTPMAAPILFDRAPVGLGGICALSEEGTATEAKEREQPAAEKQVRFFPF